MHLSQRALRIGESATLRVARRALALKAQGVDVVDFGAGEPDFDSPPVAVEAAVTALETGFTRYTAGSGTPELREAVAASYHRRYGSPWQAQHSVITVGGKCALFELAMAAFEAGDEVIVPAPAWVSFEEQIRFAGAEAVMVPTNPAESFRIRAEPILAAFTPRTRGVLINSPSNPTGGMIHAQDLVAVAAACRDRGALLIADETYDRFVYDGAAHASAAALAAEMPETIALVGSFSKTYAMTGWRIGYLLGPLALVRAVEAIQSHATSNPTSFAMKGALAALESAEPDVRRMIHEFEARRDLLVPLLNAIPGICCRPPSGAFYAFPDVSAAFGPGRANSLELAEYLLNEARVAVVPGAAFGADKHIRISFACSRAALEEGLARMSALLSD